METYFFRSHPDSYSDFIDVPKFKNKDVKGIWARIVQHNSNAWKTKRPLIILISGPSGMGKSSLALELGFLLGIRAIVSTDTLKTAIVSSCTGYPPILDFFSHECWKEESTEYSKERLITGFHSQCKALLPSIEATILHSIRHVQHTIIEGIHLLPSIYESLGKIENGTIVPLYILSSRNTLKKERLTQRYHSTYMHRSPDRYKERLPIFDDFHVWWNEELASQDFIPILNNGTAGELLAHALSVIEENLPA